MHVAANTWAKRTEHHGFFQTDLSEFNQELEILLYNFSLSWKRFCEYYLIQNTISFDLLTLLYSHATILVIALRKKKRKKKFEKQILYMNTEQGQAVSTLD